MTAQELMDELKKVDPDTEVKIRAHTGVDEIRSTYLDYDEIQYTLLIII